jgi:hypothetical protein
MADEFVIHGPDNDNPRMIFEPAFLARLRRLKAVWSAFRFLASGGKFKIYLDFSGIDPRALKPVKIPFAYDGIVVDVERHRQNAVASSLQRAVRLAGLVPAKDGEPGFRVKWGGEARKESWEESGFDVTRTPEGYSAIPRQER